MMLEVGQKERQEIGLDQEAPTGFSMVLDMGGGAQELCSSGKPLLEFHQRSALYRYITPVGCTSSSNDCDSCIFCLFIMGKFK